MTCMATFGSGVWIPGMIHTRERQQTAVPGILKLARAVCFAAAAITIARGTAGRHLATAAGPTTGTMTLASVSSSQFRWVARAKAATGGARKLQGNLGP